MFNRFLYLFQSSRYIWKSAILSQQANEAVALSYWRRCDVMTSHQRWYVILAPNAHCPGGTWRRNDVVLTSVRRRHVASTSVRRYFGVMCLLGGSFFCQKDPFGNISSSTKANIRKIIASVKTTSVTLKYMYIFDIFITTECNYKTTAKRMQICNTRNRYTAIERL